MCEYTHTQNSVTSRHTCLLPSPLVVAGSNRLLNSSRLSPHRGFISPLPCRQENKWNKKPGSRREFFYRSTHRWTKPAKFFLQWHEEDSQRLQLTFEEIQRRQVDIDAGMKPWHHAIKHSLLKTHFCSTNENKTKGMTFFFRVWTLACHANNVGRNVIRVARFTSCRNATRLASCFLVVL